MTRPWEEADFKPPDHHFKKIPEAYWSIFPFLSEGEIRVLLVLCRQFDGWDKPETEHVMVPVSARDLAKQTGLMERSIWRSLGGLHEKGIITKKNYRSLSGQTYSKYRLVKANDVGRRAEGSVPPRARDSGRHAEGSVGRHAEGSVGRHAEARVGEAQDDEFDNRTPARARVSTPTRGSAVRPDQPARARVSTPTRGRVSGRHAEGSVVPYKTIEDKTIEGGEEEEGVDNHRADQRSGPSSSCISPSFNLHKTFAAQVRDHGWLDVDTEWKRYSANCREKGRTPGLAGFKQWIDIEIERKGVQGNGRKPVPTANQRNYRGPDLHPEWTVEDWERYYNGEPA